jgi:23S rRNA (uracil1939-C5)-methyltransferase
LTVLASEQGLDVCLSGISAIPETLQQALIKHALQSGFARLSIDATILIEAAPPVLMIDGIAVTPPPGGFSQAVASTEEALRALVRAHLKRATKVADLFSGFGSFALALATKAHVHAVEHDAPALAALQQARKHASGLKPLTTERRDLFRRPLSANELKEFDGVVFDPPRAGAEAQANQLAQSAVARIAAVSCNPETLARDLEILIKGGYQLESVTPLDQFIFSPHVEAVALLKRARQPRKRSIFG